LGTITPALRTPHPPRLYAIADAESLGSTSLEEALRIMAAEGVRWIQLRAKRLSDRELSTVAESCLRIASDAGAVLWINDRADVAAMLGAPALHLGQDDLPPEAGRIVVGEATWIGRSTHDEGQIAAAAADPEVDVVAVGPVYPTGTKERPDPVVGLGLVRRARALTDKPLVAIGGLTAETAPHVLAAGADTVAVVAAICSGDIASNCRRLLAAVGGEDGR
jgi:thiamine-phosphate pyrophosphorylase